MRQNSRAVAMKEIHALGSKAVARVGPDHSRNIGSPNLIEEREWKFGLMIVKGTRAAFPLTKTFPSKSERYEFSYRVSRISQSSS